MHPAQRYLAIVRNACVAAALAMAAMSCIAAAQSIDETPKLAVPAELADAHAGDAVPENQETAISPPKFLSHNELLASDSERLARIGRHIIVGYESYDALQLLVEKQAIAGVFVTAHNVRGQSVATIKNKISQLQEIRKSQSLPPLIIAADQEGGQVSRLSPPLSRLPSLAQVLRGAKDDATRQMVVENYAAAQAADLKKIGVTLNFAPVVDLNLDTGDRDDGATKLRYRAIAADPYLVAKVADWYCGVFLKNGLMCTLKHFPGLGRVKRDTHVVSGEVTASEGMLELNDWVPFRRVMSKPNVATMLGHVRVGVLDNDTPASFSSAIIGTLIRGQWNYEGLLITDDFSMGAITNGKEGIGNAAVKSLKAGADLILVSFNEKHLDSILNALLQADAGGSLDAKLLDDSQSRILRALQQTRDAAGD